MNLQTKEILQQLRAQANPKNVEGMARFALTSKNTLGITKPALDKMAKKIGKNHELALELWKTNVYEARIIAALIDEPAKVTEKQMEEWASEFDSWGVCDNSCGTLFDKTAFAYKKALEWSKRKEEFVKRAGFVLMASLAVHDKKASDEKFLQFLPIIVSQANDERNFVRKAVNWALRQIGKRNKALNSKAIETAQRIAQIDSKAAKWIAADALRELKNTKIRVRLKK